MRRIRRVLGLVVALVVLASVPALASGGGGWAEHKTGSYKCKATYTYWDTTTWDYGRANNSYTGAEKCTEVRASYKPKGVIGTQYGNWHTLQSTAQRTDFVAEAEIANVQNRAIPQGTSNQTPWKVVYNA